MSYQEFSIKKELITRQIQQLEQQLASYPPGKLVCCKDKKYTKYYHAQNGVYVYIHKKNLSLIRQLAEKNYLSASLADLQTELDAVNSYLEHYESYSSQKEYLLNHPLYRPTLLQVLKPLSEELAQWADEDFIKNPHHSGQLRHVCLSGHIVRSKSEALIDQALFSYKIPFRYECALALGETTYYPDFTIRHPQTGQFYYWEHFGMMDSPQYAQHAFHKMQLYNSYGYVPTINLIITCETRNHPITPQDIEDILHHYFL